MAERDLVLLRRVGELLYGESKWKLALAAALGINRRTVQRWDVGDRWPPSDAVWEKLADLVRARREELALALDDIERRD